MLNKNTDTLPGYSFLHQGSTPLKGSLASVWQFLPFMISSTFCEGTEANAPATLCTNSISTCFAVAMAATVLLGNGLNSSTFTLTGREGGCFLRVVGRLPLPSAAPVLPGPLIFHHSVGVWLKSFWFLICCSRPAHLPKCHYHDVAGYEEAGC